jgi:hypothetical protein
MVNLCFVSRGIYGSHIAFWCAWGAKLQCTIFHSEVGQVLVPQELRHDTLRRTCVFASDAICRSRSAFWCIQEVKP